jgi:hypothetical protein
MEINWFTVDDPTYTGRVHGYAHGFTRSLCGQAQIPLNFVEDLAGNAPRCGNCQRGAVRLLTAQAASVEPQVERWREIAVRAVMGDGWSYAEVSGMPSFRAEVDRVAVALADAHREGILQGSASARTGSTRVEG